MARFGSLGTQYLDNAGRPLINGKIQWFEPGSTTTLKDTYADAGLTILNTNPVLLSASGRQPNIFFNGNARGVLYTEDDVQVEDRDPLGVDTAPNAFAPWIAQVSYVFNDIVIASDGRYFQSTINGNLGNDPVTSPAAWAEVTFVGVWNSSYPYALNNVAVFSDNNMYISTVANNLGNQPDISPSKWRQIGDTPANIVLGPVASVDDAIPIWDGVDGSLLKDSGTTLGDIATSIGDVQTNLDTHEADIEAHGLAKNNLAAVAAPTVDNDDSEGYSKNSVWIANGVDVYTCADATTGAAVWSAGGGGGGFYQSENTPPGNDISWWDTERDVSLQRYENGPNDPVYVQQTNNGPVPVNAVIEQYTSPDAPIAASIETFAHGLSKQPDDVQLFVRCINPVGDYEAGDIISFTPMQRTNNSSTDGACAWSSATECGWASASTSFRGYTKEAIPATVSFTSPDFVAFVVARVTTIGGIPDVTPVGMVVIESGTLNNVAEADILLDIAKYESFRLVIDKMRPVTDNVTLYYRTSSDGGVSFDEADSDYYSDVLAGSANTPSSVKYTGASGVAIVGVANVGNDAPAGGGVVDILDAGALDNTRVNAVVDVIATSGSNAIIVSGGARLEAAQANAFQVSYNSGNIAEIRYTLYGLRKAA